MHAKFQVAGFHNKSDIYIRHRSIVSIIQNYRPWTPRRTSGRIANKKI